MAPESIADKNIFLKSKICWSNVEVESLTFTAKAAGIPGEPTGPSTATCGEFLLICSGLETAQPIGGKNEKPNSSSTYLPVF